MGSGKSTLGPILANVFGYDFVDLDRVLEQRLGLSIPSFFAAEGEEAFRSVERELLTETSTLTRAVVAPGGGAFLDEANRSLMLAHGLVVYLRLSVDHLVDRLQSSRHRPLLFDEDGGPLAIEALHERIARLLADRSPLYEEAHVIVDVALGPIGQTVDRISAEIQASAKRLG